MNLNEFFAKLPHKVTNLLGSYELEKAVAALPDELFAELERAVIARLQAAENKNPNAEEIALWHTPGKRPQACLMLRARTGQPLGTCKQLLERGLLTNMTIHAFHDEPPA